MVFARSSLVAVAVIFSLGCAARSQEILNRNWDFSVRTTAATGEERTNSFSEAQIWTAGVFVGKTVTGEIGSTWQRGSLEYGFAVTPIFLQLRPQSLYGIGFEPVVLRWNSTHRFGRAAPYIELAGGAVKTNGNLPSGDTSDFNFTAEGGSGFYLVTKDHQALELGLGWLHISNANLGTRNPEFNGIEIRLGYHWFR